jgi:hypothetical protein
MKEQSLCGLNAKHPEQISGIYMHMSIKVSQHIIMLVYYGKAVCA